MKQSRNAAAPSLKKNKKKTEAPLHTVEKKTQPVRAEHMCTPLFSPLPEDGALVLSSFADIIREALPESARHEHSARADIRRLFHRLTDERPDRRTGYLNEKPILTAYIRYYHWWNLVRLASLFAGLPLSFLNEGNEAVCIDLGSGPLTLPCALWLARPELRDRKLVWYCVDISAQALAAGEELFYACAARCPGKRGMPWKLIRVKGPLGTAIKKRAVFITSANVINEIAQAEGGANLARRLASQLEAYAHERALIFLAEPGIPPAAHMLSLLRSAFLAKGFSPLAPCPHSNACPMDGRRGGKWCHFALPRDAAPDALHRLSAQAGLEKERAVLSFLLMGRGVGLPNDDAPSPLLAFRSVSDPISIAGGRRGCYGCTREGLALALHTPKLSDIPSGSLLFLHESGSRDAKSGALILESSL